MIFIVRLVSLDSYYEDKCYEYGMTKNVVGRVKI